MPSADTDIQTYVATLIEEYFLALEPKEKMMWCIENIKNDSTIRDWVESYMDDCMSLDKVLTLAILNTVDWSGMCDWCNEELKWEIMDSCEGCNETEYTELMFSKKCCNYVCALCVNKHDENCLNNEDVVK
jgi:hypothetical protein